MLEMIFLHEDFLLPGYITIGWDAWVILKSQYRWGGTHVPNFCMISSINDFRARSWFIFLQTALTEMNTYPRTNKLTRSSSPFGEDDHYWKPPKLMSVASSKFGNICESLTHLTFLASLGYSARDSSMLRNCARNSLSDDLYIWPN